MSPSRRTVLAGVGAGLSAVIGSAIGLGVLDDEPLFDFDDDIEEPFRSRIRNSGQNALEILPSSPSGPVNVSFFRPSDVDQALIDKAEREYRAAMHVAAQPEVLQVARKYTAGYTGGQTIAFPAPDAVRSKALELADEDIPPLAEWYPMEPVVAHELTHAVQFTRFNLTFPDQTYDGREARTHVIEGTASYVESRYRSMCQSESDWSCNQVPFSIASISNHPEMVALRKQPYVTGHAFVAEIAERDDWDAIRSLHESPPVATVDAMFPGRYHEGPTDPETVSAPEPDREWIQINSNRLGAAALYGKLYALGAVDHDVDPRPVSPPEPYRTPLLRSWQGDRIAVYGHVDDPDRTGHVWQVDFGSKRAAERLARLVREAYANHGSDHDRGWSFDGRWASVDQSDRRVTFHSFSE